MAKVQGPKEEKTILIFTKKSGPNLGQWAQKSTMRFMRTLRPSSAALAQFSWSLLLMALVTGSFLGRIASISLHIIYFFSSTRTMKVCDHHKYQPHGTTLQG